MLLEVTSRDSKIGDYPFQYTYTGSSALEEGDLRENLDLLFCSLIDRRLFNPSTYSILQLLGQADMSPASRTLNYLSQALSQNSGTFAPCGAWKKEDILSRKISEFVAKLINEEELFKKIDKDKFLKSLSIMLDKLPPVTLIPEDELNKRLRKVMALEVASGMLNDLTPSQLNIFKESIKRRHLFE